MSRVAASMMASRVERPSRGRLVGLGVLVAVIVCTNRLVQNHTRQYAPRQVPGSVSRAAPRLRRGAANAWGLGGHLEAPILNKMGDDAEGGHHDGLGVEAEDDDAEGAEGDRQGQR